MPSLAPLLSVPAPNPQVLAFAREALQSATAQHREGALTALAVVFEGCAEPLRKRLKVWLSCGLWCMAAICGQRVPYGAGERGLCAYCYNSKLGNIAGALRYSPLKPQASALHLTAYPRLACSSAGRSGTATTSWVSNPLLHLLDHLLLSLRLTGHLICTLKHCRSPLCPQDVMPLLLSGLRDGDAKVRGAAAFSLGMAAEFLQPDIVEYYKEVRTLLGQL